MTSRRTKASTKKHEFPSYYIIIFPRSKYINFLYKRGVQSSLHVPRLNPWGTCQLTPTQVSNNSIHQDLEMGRNHLVFLPLLEFEPETSWFLTHFVDHQATPIHANDIKYLDLLYENQATLCFCNFCTSGYGQPSIQCGENH